MFPKERAWCLYSVLLGKWWQNHFPLVTPAANSRSCGTAESGAPVVTSRSGWRRISAASAALWGQTRTPGEEPAGPRGSGPPGHPGRRSSPPRARPAVGRPTPWSPGPPWPLCLTVFSADCIPVLLCDPRKKVAAAVHAGWRGTALGIAARAAEYDPGLWLPSRRSDGRHRSGHLPVLL